MDPFVPNGTVRFLLEDEPLGGSWPHPGAPTPRRPNPSTWHGGGNTGHRPPSAALWPSDGGNCVIGGRRVNDQIDAITLADRIAALDHGQVASIDTPDALWREPASAFVAGFIGAPAA